MKLKLALHVANIETILNKSRPPKLYINISAPPLVGVPVIIDSGIGSIKTTVTQQVFTADTIIYYITPISEMTDEMYAGLLSEGWTID